MYLLRKSTRSFHSWPKSPLKMLSIELLVVGAAGFDSGAAKLVLPSK